MRHTAVAGHLKPEEIKERMLSSESRQQFQRWQVIYITVAKRLKADEVGELVGVCTGTVHQWVHQYNHKGPDVLILQGRGGRRRELLSWNEEEELLEVFFQDEARFGRMSNPARCWAPAGFHPIVPMQRVREYTYIYGLEKVLMKALIAISYNKEIIQSLAGFHWAIF